MDIGVIGQRCIWISPIFVLMVIIFKDLNFLNEKCLVKSVTTREARGSRRTAVHPTSIGDKLLSFYLHQKTLLLPHRILPKTISQVERGQR